MADRPLPDENKPGNILPTTPPPPPPPDVWSRLTAEQRRSMIDWIKAQWPADSEEGEQIVDAALERLR